jgi:hypothetical protein
LLRCGFVFVLAAVVQLVPPTMQTDWGQALMGSRMLNLRLRFTFTLTPPGPVIELYSTFSEIRCSDRRESERIKPTPADIV